MTPNYNYKCLDCGMYCRDVGMHQHADGEWVDAADLRRFYQFLRWIKWAKGSGLLSLWER